MVKSSQPKVNFYSFNLNSAWQKNTQIADIK